MIGRFYGRHKIPLLPRSPQAEGKFYRQALLMEIEQCRSTLAIGAADIHGTTGTIMILASLDQSDGRLSPPFKSFFDRRDLTIRPPERGLLGPRHFDAIEEIAGERLPFGGWL